MSFAVTKIKSDADFLNRMPDEIQDSVARAIKQADKGELKSHTEVMKKYKKWLKK